MWQEIGVYRGVLLSVRCFFFVLFHWFFTSISIFLFRSGRGSIERTSSFLLDIAKTHRVWRQFARWTSVRTWVGPTFCIFLKPLFTFDILRFYMVVFYYIFFGWIFLKILCAWPLTDSPWIVNIAVFRIIQSSVWAAAIVAAVVEIVSLEVVVMALVQRCEVFPDTEGISNICSVFFHIARSYMCIKNKDWAVTSKL